MRSAHHTLRRTRPYLFALATALAMPAFAQSTTGTGTGSTGTATTSGTGMTEVRRDTDRGFNWGWLGLIGLAGLLGRRKTDEVTRVDATRTTGQR